MPPGAHEPTGLGIVSARELCRKLLSACRSKSGQYLPVTPAELLPQLQAQGFVISERDTEALLRDLAESGEIVEIDASAGFRWCQPAA
ncbi:MAG: hypothetical protein JO041_08285 [Acidobacteria bacterium]|nr:hypothetical protein [Acidobacteriota bacterium]